MDLIARDGCPALAGGWPARGREITPPDAQGAAIQQETVLNDPLEDRGADLLREGSGTQVGDPERGPAGGVAIVDDGEEQLAGVLRPGDLVRLVDDEAFRLGKPANHVFLGLAGILGPGGTDLRDQLPRAHHLGHQAAIRPGVRERMGQPGLARAGHAVQDGVARMLPDPLQQRFQRYPMPRRGQCHALDTGIPIAFGGRLPRDLRRLPGPAGRAVLSRQETQPPVRVPMRDTVGSVIRAGAELLPGGIDRMPAMARHEVREKRAHRDTSSGGRMPASMASCGHQRAQQSSAPSWPASSVLKRASQSGSSRYSGISRPRFVAR